ncbi:MAG: flavin reductase [Eubacterium sp.]|nr:flavin reductase [Eubacterium sp.]
MLTPCQHNTSSKDDYHYNKGGYINGKLTENRAWRMGTTSGNKVDKSEAFAWTMGDNGAPLIDEAKVSIECEVDGNYELEHFDHFICKILATYADEAVLDFYRKPGSRNYSCRCKEKIQ